MYDYEQKLDNLRTGKIEELKITKEEFEQFQPVFYQYKYRKQIVGEAYHGGDVIFRFNSME